jgi:hypothetical protein
MSSHEILGVGKVHFQEDLGHTGIFQNDAALGFSYKSEMIV